ncbi:hypothetical protein L2E82_48825 [Cichorium intybus]|uniref:Uncharacterized protein n=1 Tax=Cichorium intybus TaxID=13427 RepID=A0ACB8YYU8_CICIN|nr:hypothetical protein L2E82_48825 [Cichorium intybus]
MVKRVWVGFVIVSGSGDSLDTYLMELFGSNFTMNDNEVLGGGWPEIVMTKAVHELSRKTLGALLLFHGS